MEKTDIEELRGRVACAAVLERAGWAIDAKESTRRAVKFRRGDGIVIVIHEGRGWFDPLSDAKGDVFSLVAHLEGVGFATALERVGDLVGYHPLEPVWNGSPVVRNADASIADRWRRRRKPWRGSATWRYLAAHRAIPAPILATAIGHGLLREGAYGSMWAAHTDPSGMVVGWEERGPGWRGFSTGGAKTLFRLGRTSALRVCITEAAIDAMSLAAIERLRADTLYASTGGGWAPATEAAIRTLAARPDARLVAATDANAQGEIYAERLRAIAGEVGCDVQRLRPAAEDWNEELKKEREDKPLLPHTRRPRQW